jgi:predicted CXXCH cytochrome family protein
MSAKRSLRRSRATRVLKFSAWVFASVILLAEVPGGWVTEARAQGDLSSAGASEAGAQKPENATCLGCHGLRGFAVPTADGKMRQLHIEGGDFARSVHGKRLCVECHQDIVKIPHRKNIDRKVGCVQCHQSLWEAAQKENKTQEFARLGVVVKQIESYMGSIHARPNIEDQSRTNATCYNCHNAHYVFPIGSKGRAEFRLNIPNVCGKCHSTQRYDYFTSVHGKEISAGNPKAAVCIDCHTTHDIESPEVDSMKLLITENCGNCHDEQLQTYRGTYHGQVTKLGYAYTAKCFDCHGHHKIQWVDNQMSKVHESNRLETCRQCHKDATQGFISFHPHGNTRDFDRYPYMYVASKFMISLLGGVFAFFWTHAALWFYREYKDRKQGKNKPHVQMDKLPRQEGKYFRRFSAMWRFAHLMLALAVMTLVLTGTAVLYADSFWAPTVMNVLGGPDVAAILHRIAAVTFIIIFFGHLIYFALCISRNWKTFKWFGPNSLLPNLQDFRDAAAMFRWFFGKGPRPIFDRWTYWEKFDYWAPFWGMAIIGLSGVMMWFPAATASVFPGWVFNVATIVHGEEAFLAAVFIFTVHFFNCHFRPDKFPQDIVMFTGVVPLEEYKREHTVEYRRLVESGELEKYLVDAPSRPMTRASKVLGASLIIVGLTLLLLVLLGFWERVV